MKKEDQVKKMLADFNLPQSWLVRELNDCGEKMDKATLNRILGCKYIGKKAETTLDLAIHILTKYAEFRTQMRK